MRVLARIYLRQRCFDGSVKLFKITARCSGAPGFFRRKIPHSSAYTMSEKAIRFRHPDYNPDWAQKLISSSMSRHLSTRNISSKSMHAFLSNLANRQTDKQTWAKTCTSSSVGGTKWSFMSLFAVYRSDRSIGEHIDHLGRDCRACRSCHSASSLSLRLRPVRHTHGCDGICRRCVQHSVSLFSHSSHVLCLRHAFLEGDDIVFFVKPVKCQSVQSQVWKQTPPPSGGTLYYTSATVWL